MTASGQRYRGAVRTPDDSALAVVVGGVARRERIVGDATNYLARSALVADNGLLRVGGKRCKA